jgi:cyclase
MVRTRVIPCLLLKDLGLVKTVRFKEPKYLGDPINVVRIFNDKEVDELVLLDIGATAGKRGPAYDRLEKIAAQCFMPLCYGGGIREIADLAKLFALGIEKAAINAQAVENPRFIRTAADRFGSQSIVVSIDVRRGFFGGEEVVTGNGRRKTGLDPVRFAVEMEKQGAGELLLNSVDRDGTMDGYDLDLIQRVSRAVSIPVIACGGAGRVDDLAKAVQHGAAAAGAGSLFVFQLPHRAVLINYPGPEQLQALFPQAQ